MRLYYFSLAYIFRKCLNLNNCLTFLQSSLLVFLVIFQWTLAARAQSCESIFNQKIMRTSDYYELERSLFKTDYENLFDDFNAHINPWVTNKKLMLKANNQRNEEIIQKLNSWPRLKTESGQKTGLTQLEIESIFQFIKNNKVASIEALSKYDPEGKIGLCFARAALAHREARLAGLNRNQIRKIFVIGKIQNTLSEPWGYHMATVVRRDDGKWVALDTYLQKPTIIEEWFDHMKSSSVKDKRNNVFPIRYYSTSASRFSPLSDERYSLKYLGVGKHNSKKINRFNNFFEDFYQSLKNRKKNQINLELDESHFQFSEGQTLH